MASADSTSELAEQVIETRQNVETLNEQYETEKEKIYNDLKTIGVKKAELEANIQTDRLRNQQIANKISSIKQSIKETSAFSEDLMPLYEKYSENLKKHIEASLPFKKTERLESLNRLNEKVKQEEVSLSKALTQLWSMVEDEKRMARENSLEKQIITINGKEQLAQVARLGMMMMYFTTENGEVGQVVKNNNQWKFKAYTQSQDKEQVKELILALKKQIRTGYFEVPANI